MKNRLNVRLALLDQLGTLHILSFVDVREYSQ
jgi:hypothetical protein